MATTLGKAPLIELMAELSWSPAMLPAQSDTGAPVMLPAYLLDPSHAENFFMRFTGEIYRHGFRSVERLIPLGMGLPPNQMACRYRQADTNAAPVIAQIGPTQFSMNALPPYKTWGDFRPWIEKGVTSLFDALGEPGVPVRASVRYIDGFRSDVMEGKPVSEFLSRLGFNITPPPALTKRARGSIKASAEMSIPLDNSLRMKVIVKEGIIKGERVAIMDTNVALLRSLNPELKAVMEAFDLAHNVIHDAFFEIASPIMDQLCPSNDKQSI